MRLSHLLAFLIVFTIDVRLKAEPLNDDVIALYPAKCLNVSYPCSVKVNHAEKYTFNFQDQEITLSKYSIVTLHEDFIILVKGSMLFEEPTSIKVNTLHASTTLFSSTGLIRVEGGRTMLTPFTGMMTAKARSHKVEQKVLSGSSLIVGEVASTGEALEEFPRPINFGKIIRRWGNMTQLSKTDFKERAIKLKSKVKRVAQSYSNTYQQIAERRIASHRESVEAYRRRKAIAEKENAQLRSLFRRKNYFE